MFAIKRKNAINERLFVGEQEGLDDLNPYARIIADEALRRGISVEVLDARAGEMRLSHGGRSVVTRESLSELTTAVAMSRSSSDIGNPPHSLPVADRHGQLCRRPTLTSDQGPALAA